MCGIVGEWRLDHEPVNTDSLVRARDSLTARGPDDAGLHVEGNVGLGHRRLSIIDLSPAGRMPMSNETGDVWSVFNGEIYNFAAIRDELRAKGHQFRSATDSEVTVHAYEEWGTDCFARFDGMFAIAIWDRARKRLVLGRDITGEKPLFYAYQPGKRVAFGSTLRSLIAFGNGWELDPDSLRRYIEFGFVPAPGAILRDVYKVPPASFVVFEENAAPKTTAYWRLADAALGDRTGVRTLADATDQLHEVLRDVVRSRMVADVPVGAFLSGGVDSSLVVALMAEAGQTVRTYTIAFREPKFDESEYAHRVARHLGVENTTMVLTSADVLRELPHVTAAFDEPMADYSAVPSFAVARLAHRHVKVALTGDGADEAFGGYRYYSGTRAFERMARLVPQAVRAFASGRADLIPVPRLRRAIRRGSVKDPALYFGLSGFYRGATAERSLGLVLPDAERPEEIVAEYIRALPSLRATEAGMLWDATHTLPDAWLTKVDRTTMAVGLEARAPLLARRVLELAFKMPLDFRVRGLEKKIVLRALLRRYLPADLVDRPKQGFTAPMRDWFANELAGELTERLAPSRVERFGVFDAAGVQTLLAEQRSGQADHTQMLWALFHLDRWYDAHLLGLSA